MGFSAGLDILFQPEDIVDMKSHDMSYAHVISSARVVWERDLNWSENETGRGLRTRPNQPVSAPPSLKIGWRSRILNSSVHHE